GAKPEEEPKELETKKGRRFHAFADGKGMSYAIADDRTCMLAMTPQEMERALNADSKNRPAWYDQWCEMAKSPLAVAAVPRENLGGGTLADYVPAALKTIVEKTDLVTCTLNFPEGNLLASLFAQCSSAEAQREVVKASRQLLELAETAIDLETNDLRS